MCISKNDECYAIYLLCLYLLEFLGVTFGDEASPGERGGKGGVIDDILSLTVELAIPVLFPCRDNSCNFGSKMCRNSLSTISTHSGSCPTIKTI